jgi:hypothetical protein
VHLEFLIALLAHPFFTQAVERVLIDQTALFLVARAAAAASPLKMPTAEVALTDLVEAVLVFTEEVVPESEAMVEVALL